MTDPHDPPALSRREREILDIVHRRGRATAAEVRAELSGTPGDSGVRTLLRLMEEKGLLTHAVDGPRYVYAAATPREVAGRSAVRRLIDTYFGGSPHGLVSALLDDDALDDDALRALARLVEERRGRPR
jgi:predicted transcriptional regulator